MFRTSSFTSRPLTGILRLRITADSPYENMTTAGSNLKIEKISLSLIQNTKTLHSSTERLPNNSLSPYSITKPTQSAYSIDADKLVKDQEDSLFSITLWEALDIDSYEEGLSCGM
jgi:hypothetical protein